MRLALATIRRDGGTQPRALLDESTVDTYKEAIEAGAKFPPVVVFYDGSAHWLADGFHRFVAHEELGHEKVEADVRQGTLRDAILFSCGANSSHGLPRTNADKRRAVTTLLRDEEWARKSDRWVAEKACVSSEMVRKSRGEVPTVGTCEPREGKDGKLYPAKPDRAPPSPPLPFDKPAPVARPAPEPRSAPVEFEPEEGEDIDEPSGVEFEPEPDEPDYEPPAPAPPVEPAPAAYSTATVRDSVADPLRTTRRLRGQLGESDWQTFKTEMLAILGGR